MGQHAGPHTLELTEDGRHLTATTQDILKWLSEHEIEGNCDSGDDADPEVFLGILGTEKADVCHAMLHRA